MRCTLLLSLFCFLVTSNAYSLDRRVSATSKVFLQTAAMGTAAGLAAGTVAVVAFDGSARTFAKMTSIGLIGGVVFGLGVLLAPKEMFVDHEQGPSTEKSYDSEDEARLNILKPTEDVAWTPVYQKRF